MLFNTESIAAAASATNLTSASIVEYNDQIAGLGGLRSLAAYPECAVIQERYDRETCCRRVAISESAIDFCNNDVIYTTNVFSECESSSFVKMFDCCDRLAKGDLYIAFDCKTNNSGGGQCSNQQQCLENYEAGLKKVELVEKIEAEKAIEKE